MVEFRLNTAENELCDVEIPMSEWRSGATVGRGRSRRPRGRRQSDRAPTVRPATPNPKKPSRSDTRDKFQAGQHFSELAAVRSEPPFTSSRPPARGGSRALHPRRPSRPVEELLAQICTAGCTGLAFVFFSAASSHFIRAGGCAACPCGEVVFAIFFFLLGPDVAASCKIFFFARCNVVELRSSGWRHLRFLPIP